LCANIKQSGRPSSALRDIEIKRTKNFRTIYKIISLNKNCISDIFLPPEKLTISKKYNSG